MSLTGDYNDDRVVNAAEYTVWRDNVGAPAGTLANDADGGVIGAAQYVTWKTNFGTSDALLSARNTAVPEPASLGLFIFGLSALILSRRGDRRCSVREQNVCSVESIGT